MLQIELQPRDVAILRKLFECRIMTASHIATIHFEGKSEATKKRLQKLKAAGLLGERRRHRSEPAVLFLSAKAFTLLREQGILSQYPSLALSTLQKRSQVSDLTIRHELEIMDVKAALHSAIAALPTLKIEEFSTWPILFQFTAFRNSQSVAEVLVKPDGFIRIFEKGAEAELYEHAFFLELDRSTETQDTLVSRAGCYADFYKSGGFAIRNGGTRDQFKDFPFRVLIVCQNAERRNNTAERLLQITPPIFTQVLLSTFAEVIADPFGAVWITPRDYRDAVVGSPYDASTFRKTWQYRRQTERETLVEQRIIKSKLLES